LARFLSIVEDWHPVFCQPRSHLRAVRQALGGLLRLGRRTLTRIILPLSSSRTPSIKNATAAIGRPSVSTIEYFYGC
jgi:hypothetical protein